MAIVASNLYSGRVVTGDSGYPLGKAQDIVNGEKGTGTPLRASWVNDQWGFLQALLDAANITPSGTPDQVGQSDYLDAVNKLIREPLALKIFQSPTDGGLTEIQTRTVNSGEVYEVRKTSDDSLATIYSDAAGATEIVQNGTSNVSDSAGVVEFFIDDGDYYVEVGGVKGGFTVTYLKDNSVSDGIAANLLVKNRGGDSATRVHIEPRGVIHSGTASKQDWMFDDYNANPVNYRILGHFLQNGDLSGNGRNAEANVTLKSAGGFYGNFPLMMWGYQDNSADQSIAMKMLYMDVNEMEKPTPHLGRWESGREVVSGDYIQSNNFEASPRATYGLYKATTSGVTGETQPIHLSGGVSDGGVTWEFIKDYFITAQSKDLHSMMLFGRKSDYPVAGGHEYTAQFARGLGIHQGRDLAFFDSDDSISGRRVAIGSDIYDYFKGGAHLYKHTDTYTQHIGGGTIRSLKNITDGDGQSSISVDVRGADTINLAFTQATSVAQFICDANQEFRVRVQNDNVVTLLNGGSLKLINGSQLLGVRSVISFYARTSNQAIQDGYIGS